MAYHQGKLEAVVTCKQLKPDHKPAVVEDYERGGAAGILPQPWQTDTCIGDWFYNAARPRDRSYKSAEAVLQRLADVVSKNGNLLLSIPQRGDGSIDGQEEGILDALASWMTVNGEAIVATRPWHRFGEGPTRAVAGLMNEGEQRPYGEQDIRFTTGRGSLYALLLAPQRGPLTIVSLGGAAGAVERVTLLGGPALAHRRDAAGLHVTLPQIDGLVPVLKLEGRGLV